MIRLVIILIVLCSCGGDVETEVAPVEHCNNVAPGTPCRRADGVGHCVAGAVPACE